MWIPLSRRDRAPRFEATLLDLRRGTQVVLGAIPPCAGAAWVSLARWVTPQGLRFDATLSYEVGSPSASPNRFRFPCDSALERRAWSSWRRAAPFASRESLRSRCRRSPRTSNRSADCQFCFSTIASVPRESIACQPAPPFVLFGHRPSSGHSTSRMLCEPTTARPRTEPTTADLGPSRRPPTSDKPWALSLRASSRRRHDAASASREHQV